MVALEELALAYVTHKIDLAALEQKAPEYWAINQNGPIPTLVDDGFAVFESGATLVYLTEKTGNLLLPTPKAADR